MVFTITSFSGDFTKLNAGLPLVKLLGSDNLTAVFNELVFNGAQVFNGKMTTVNVPLVHTDAKIFQKPFTIEILGDWTRGIETVAIDNVEFYY